jgi:hypothetical protein
MVGAAYTMTRRNDRLLLAAGAVAFVVACVLTRPLGITIVDEVHYFTEALAIRRNLPLGKAASYVLANGMLPFHGPLYPAGWPALLAPFTELNWPWPFAATAVLHLATAAVMALVFKQRGLRPSWALLALAQPTLLTFSRTLMAEPLAVFQTALLLLIAGADSPFLLGLVAGFAPLIKLSQLVVAAPFVAFWIWHQPEGRRYRAALLAGPGAVVGLAGFLWFSKRAYGQWVMAGYLPTYLAFDRGVFWLGMGLLQLAVAWPLLILGLRRSRLEERAAILAMLVVFSFYEYHYRGPTLLATLIVGARLYSPAILLLLPGYATLLSGNGRATTAAGLAVATLAAITTPFVILRAVSSRRSQLEETRNEVLYALRPPCLLAYSKPALKLLLPLPPDKRLHGPDDIERLDADLGRGACVDLLDPVSEPSTYQHPPVYPDAFAALLDGWPHRDRSPSPGIRLFWLDRSDKELVGTGAR